MLSFQGNTAPYLQNAYVRIRSIFRKAESADGSMGVAKGSQVEFGCRRNGIWRSSFVSLERLCRACLNDFRPNMLANYLFELANSFHAFYEACPVLKADEQARSSRLALCDLTGRVLQRGLQLLGIEVPERM